MSLISDGVLVFKNKGRDVIEKELKTLGFDPDTEDENSREVAGGNLREVPDDGAGGESDGKLARNDLAGGQNGGYMYLLRMPIWSATAEKLAALKVSVCMCVCVCVCVCVCIC